MTLTGLEPRGRTMLAILCQFDVCLSPRVSAANFHHSEADAAMLLDELKDRGLAELVEGDHYRATERGRRAFKEHVVFRGGGVRVVADD